jgi:hypothetical protein
MVFEHGEVREVLFIGEDTVVVLIKIISGDEIQTKRWKDDKLAVNPCGHLVPSIWLMFKLECKSTTTFEHIHTVWYVPFSPCFSMLRRAFDERAPSNWRHRKRACRLTLGNTD